MCSKNMELAEVCYILLLNTFQDRRRYFTFLNYINIDIFSHLG
jgi:hypothetical protein